MDEIISIDNSADEQQEPKEGNCSAVSGHSGCGTCAVRGGKLHVYDWLEDLPEPPNASDLVEVQFKNTRKGYYRNSNGIALKKGDIVAVESSPGHDIGEVTLMGRLVYLQMHKNRINPANYEFKRVYRIARQTDIDKWMEARDLEQATMLESRQIAERLNLNMKIGDVEYQGDKTKAIFYYIADERVDFRELIKVLADRFRVRIEMKQIGARQEAGRIGGIGPCGRELCCASWMTSFVSVTTHSARIQDISLNPIKLAGQCGKLKCCLNYELDCYLDALQSFPPTNVPLQTGEGTFYFFKYDIFKKIMWYSPEKDRPQNIVAVDADHVREIQEMNKQNQIPEKLGSSELMQAVTEEVGYNNVVELDDLTRFDDKNKRSKNNDRNNRNGRRSNNRNDRNNDNRNDQNRQNNDRHNDNRNRGQQNQEKTQQAINPQVQPNAPQNEQQRPQPSLPDMTDALALLDEATNIVANASQQESQQPRHDNRDNRNNNRRDNRNNHYHNRGPRDNRGPRRDNHNREGGSNNGGNNPTPQE